MADTKISELTSITGANVNDTADELAIVDDSATQTKKITRAELFQDVLKIKVGGGADGAGNADELVASKDQTNVGISILTEDATGYCRLLFGSQTNNNAAKVQHNENNDQLTVQAAGELRLQTGGTNDRVTIDSSGNVGIGNSSPSAPLDVTGTVKSTVSSTGDFNLNAVSSGGGNYRIYPDDAATANPTWLHQSNSSEDQAWVIGGVERMRLASDGKVGIGTSSPTSAALVVSGTGLGSSIRVADTTNSVNVDVRADATGGLVRTASNDPLVFATNQVERVRIDSSGNVGIGNTSPSVPLDVTGNAAVSGKAKVGTGADGSANGDELVLSKDGNNIGMTILCADTDGNSRIYLGSQTDTQAARLHHSESNDRLFLQAKGDLYFQTGGSGTTMTLNGDGDLDVTGALSKGSGSFKIDHPLKPDTHHLVHSFIEGPQADNLYRGTVALVGGAATVNLDTAGRMSEGTFVALNGNVQCFTSNEQGWTAVRGSVSGNILTIEAQDSACTDTVSWMVIGERHDQHMIDTAWTDAQGRVITEPEKVEDTQEEAA